MLLFWGFRFLTAAANKLCEERGRSSLSCTRVFWGQNENNNNFDRVDPSGLHTCIVSSPAGGRKKLENLLETVDENFKKSSKNGDED